MSNTLTTVANDQHDSSAWLLFLELAIPNTPTVRIVQNNEDIIWQGHTYQAVGIENISVDFARGEIPNIDITIPNVANIMSAYIEQYYAYQFENGVEGNEISVLISVTPHKLIQEDENCNAAYSVTTQFVSAKIKNKDCVITVGAFNIFNIPFPNMRITQSCQWDFKSIYCGYSGDGQSCNKTLTQCRLYNNSSRFLGFMGVMPLGVTLA